MRVALDYLPAVGHAPGTGRYARELVRAVAALEPRPELVLFDLGRAPRGIAEPALGLAGRDGIRRISSGLPRRLWDLAERVGLGPERRLGQVDLVHRTRPAWPPVRRAPTVRAIAELPPPGDPAEGRVRAELDADDAWIVFSGAGEEALVERFGRDPRRVFRTPVGCDHWLRDLADGPGGAHAAPADPPYLLVLGALRSARFPDLVLDAYDALRAERRELELVFCGARGDAAELLQRRLSFSAGRSSIRWIPPVEAELPKLVAEASALVHLSVGELTAVTPLEAFAAGTPAVVSDTPVFREALGDLAEYVVTPPSLRHRKALPEQLAAAVDSARDPHARRRRRELGALHPWSRTARATMDIWEELADPHRARAPRRS